ncbi:MAG TPA: hypothetical protein DDZ40_01475 [Deltaproteobacteria bacterium]|nr:hypothetical protein [Deltaproteobacteria bacterium]
MGLVEELGLDRPIETVEHESLLNIVYTGTMIARASFRYFQGHRLTDAQFNVLVQLKYAGDSALSQAALGRRLVVNKADMTGIIDRLERTGLVERVAHPNDRRVNLVRMTAEGENAVEALEEGYLEGVGKLMSGISRTDLDRLNRILEKVRRNVKEKLLPPGRSGE